MNERPDPAHASCFAAGTLVHTKEGLKPIEKVRVGDWVLSYPDDQTPPDKLREDHEYTYRQVTQTFVTENQPLSKLIVANIATNVKETIYVTAKHPIYCQYRGWVPVSAIEASDVVENYRFRHLMVARVFHGVDTATVYNIEVDEFHTYYVGEQGVWVHNKYKRWSGMARKVLPNKPARRRLPPLQPPSSTAVTRNRAWRDGEHV